MLAIGVGPELKLPNFATCILDESCAEIRDGFEQGSVSYLSNYSETHC